MNRIPRILERCAALLTAGVLSAACSPAVFDDMDDFGFSSCFAPLDEGADPDQLRDHVKRTLPFVPRKLDAKQATPWGSGRAIAVHAGEVFAVDRDNGTLVVLDANDALKVKRTIEIGPRPEHVVVGPAGDAWVTVRHGAKVAHVAAGAGTVDKTVDVGVEPISLALDASGKTLYVTVAGEQKVKVIAAATGEILQTLSTGQERPRAVTVAASTGKVVVVDQNGTSRIYTRKDSGLLSSGLSRPLRRQNPGHMLGFSAKNLKSWRALSGAVHPETGDTLVAHVLVSPGDKNSLMNSATGKSSKQGSSGGYGAGGDACDPGAPIRPVEVSLTQVSPSKSTMQQEFPVADATTGRNFLSRFDQPSDVNHHPSVSLAFVTAYGTDNVLVLNTGAGDVMRFPTAELRVGQAPKAIAFSADGRRAFVLNQHGFSVSEVDISPLVDLAVDQYKKGVMPPQTPVLTLDPVRTVAFAKDPNPALLQKGRRLFTFTGNDKVSQSQRFACASCHLEGTEDKLTWFITDGPRQTPSLAGRLQGTGPFNWLGTEDHLQDNMGETIKRMGGEGLSKSELVALEQFMIHGLVPPPNPNVHAELTEAQARGKKLFDDPETGCAGCHVAGTGTDGLNWDVGTVSKEEKTLEQMRAAMENRKPRTIRFNTPSLRGLWATAPYLHDGSAKTLRVVLDRTATTMGKTKHLSSKQKDDLVAYLKTL